MVDEVKQDAGDVTGVVAPVGAGTGRMCVEATVEHRKLAEQTLFRRGELLVGPVHHGAEGMMAAISPAAGGKQPEPVLQVPGQLADSGPGQAGGGKLDGEWQAVQPGAQSRDRRDVRSLLRSGRVGR